MKAGLWLFIAALLLAGCGTATLPECDFAISGEPFEWEGTTFHIGKTLVIDGRTFELPNEVCEMNSSAWKADFNGDGEMDYLLSVAEMGNGKNFGNGVLYIFLSQWNNRYQRLKSEYAGFAQ